MKKQYEILDKPVMCVSCLENEAWITVELVNVWYAKRKLDLCRVCYNSMNQGIAVLEEKT